MLITGATSGIGQASAARFAAEGYQVFATYRKPADLPALQGRENIHPVELDVTDAAQLEAAVELIAREVGEDGLYAIVNNAGITYAAPFEFADEKRAREVMDVNLMAPFRITKALLPLLIRHNSRNEVRSRVVNVASWAGLMSSPFIPFYNASKFALVGLSESMHYDLGLLGVHTVLAVPGITRTPLLEKTTSGGIESLNQMPAAGRERYRDMLDHYATMSASSRDSRLLPTAERIAGKLHRIVDRPKPRFKYHLAPDAWLVDELVTRLLPWRLRAAINARAHRLALHPG
ncbi:short-chain dehydrogenase [Acrocarpospora corrugata]|uniref:Short-chain dehydrogenase n=1 Tax=Acrocarpospora corrugata TaxID=35763 RepID=A0A5M3VWV7_9ACTN|nr:short-chain dehydrogenase [Acrocarpospora corrugata]